MKTICRTLLLIFALLGSTSCVNRLFYYPTAEQNTLNRPTTPFEEVRFPSSDGTQLFGWFVPAAGEAKGTVLHFHGNAQNLTDHFAFVSWLPKEGYNVMAFDYRGYGLSEGKPERAGIYRDCLAAATYLRARPDINPDRVLLFGQSLGGANAINLAGRHPELDFRAVITDSAFSSYRGIIRDKGKLIPVVRYLRWPLSFVVVSNRYAPDKVVDRIAPTPLLILHGTKDNVVDYRHGERLYQKAREPKELWSIEGGGHTDAIFRPDPPYRKRLLAIFEQALENR